MEKYTAVQSTFWLSGFFLLGALLSLLGSLLIVWRYHIEGDARQAGLYFLALDLGFVLVSALCARMGDQAPIRLLPLLACALATLLFIALPFVAPPASFGLRLLFMALVGGCAGILSTSLVRRLQHSIRFGSAATLTRAGLLLSAGACTVTAVLGALYAKGAAGWEVASLLLIPLLTALPYIRTDPAPVSEHTGSTRQSKPRNLRALAMGLFGLLLFCQLGNELAIAGWLPTLLIRRLGIDPANAIFSLALYFLLVALGRVVSSAVLKKMSHRRILLTSIVVAMTGYLLLALTHTVPAALTGIVLVGFGFGPIFPLLGENLDGPLVSQPGFSNGVFSLAIMGAMATPWLLGYVFEYLGNNYVLLIPAFGSVAVFVLALLLMLEGRLMRERSRAPHGELLY